VPAPIKSKCKCKCKCKIVRLRRRLESDRTRTGMKLNSRFLAVTLAVAAVLGMRAGESSAALSLFNGKDLTGWKAVGTKPAPAQWQVGTAALDPADPAKLSATPPGSDLVSPDKGANLVTEQDFADCTLETEFMMSRNSNSGIKLMKIYEIQLLDSFGKQSVTSSDCGAVYKESAPRVNACRKPGEWQSLLVDFRAPRFDANGKKVSNAKFVKVVLNGRVVQEDVEVEHGTNVSRDVKEVAKAPLYLQGDHGPVAFRNMRITPR
jgi:hypothetical protein